MIETILYFNFCQGIIAGYRHQAVVERKMGRNLVKKIREDLMMSKTELAKKAKVSPITIGRIENGMPCRLETMRKIINGLGKTLSDKDKIFPND